MMWTNVELDHRLVIVLSKSLIGDRPMATSSKRKALFSQKAAARQAAPPVKVRLPKSFRKTAFKESRNPSHGTVHTCIYCHGSKKMTIMIGTAGDSMEIGCVHCNAVGSVSATEAQQNADKAAFTALWCGCKTSSGSSYVPDCGSVKHHWTCDDCGKVTQIG
jgi:hypothetical protein